MDYSIISYFCRSTACIAQCYLPRDTFLCRLFTRKSFNFDKIDDLLDFTPLRIDQSEIQIKKVNKLQVRSISFTSSKKKNQQPSPKWPHCTFCGTFQPKNNKELFKNVGHEE